MMPKRESPEVRMTLKNGIHFPTCSAARPKRQKQQQPEMVLHSRLPKSGSTSLMMLNLKLSRRNGFETSQLNRTALNDVWKWNYMDSADAALGRSERSHRLVREMEWSSRCMRPCRRRRGAC